MNARANGARYENFALAHLERAGLDLIARNAGCRHGELDLVMRDGDTVVFVEVRYRASSGFGDGLDSVGAAKRAKLVRAAAVYLARNPHLASRPCRFDVIALTGDATTVDWCRNAFETH
ncbi:MAG TPA: YraN family protein [Rhodanobacteraceae bacterium]|nr:YraN family protein [Rhodanobacteraceae bacterium]